MTEYLVIFGLVALILGALLCWWALKIRKNRGLGGGETVALDDLFLVSERLKLVGRPDRIVRQGEDLIPEEWKPSARRIYQGHRLQVISYCLLVEEKFGVRPPFGVVVLAGGKRVEVENSEELRAEVLTIAERIREHRRDISREIPVRQPAAKCRACGQRTNCGQARG
ncbi:MAG: Dna2/Cas4 domain-containing protein [Isosphaeraceae bacterium]